MASVTIELDREMEEVLEEIAASSGSPRRNMPGSRGAVSP